MFITLFFPSFHQSDQLISFIEALGLSPHILVYVKSVAISCQRQELLMSFRYMVQSKLYLQYTVHLQ